MKLKNKNMLALLAAGLSLSVFSCEKEDPSLTPDTELPTISLSHSGQANDLFGEITLTATAQDNEGIERIVFFVNGDSLGQATKEPFEITWNTQKITDGQHTLKAVAYDGANNKNEATSAITVKNTLFKASIADGYLEYYYKEFNYTHFDAWLFLTNENGNVIGEAQQMTSGAELKWKRSAEIPSDIIYLNRMVYSNTTNQDSYQSKQYFLYTYPDFSLEKAEFNALIPFKEETQGYVDITINNDLAVSSNYAYGIAFHKHSHTYHTYENPFTFRVRFIKEKEYGFTTYGSGDWTDENKLRYYKWNEFISGGSYNFQTADFEPMDAHSITFPEELSIQYIGSFGYLNADKKELINLDRIILPGVMPANSRVRLLYADQIFPNVSTFITGSAGNKYFHQKINAKAPAQIKVPAFYLEVLKHTSDFFEAVPQGEFDYGSAIFGYSSRSNTEYVNVQKTIYTGKTMSRYPIPKIPVNLLSIYPQFDNTHEFKLTSTNAMDHIVSVSYEDYLKKQFSSSYEGPSQEEFTSLTTYPQNEGGRVNQSPADPNVRMEEEIMNTWGFFPY